MKFISALAALATASAVVVPLVTFPGPKFEELNASWEANLWARGTCPAAAPSEYSMAP